MKTLIAALMVVAFPASALAGAVILKNKDGKEVTILVKRSNSTTETAIAGKASMELPGAPMTITLKKSKEKVDATDGDTVVIQKGKLTRIAPVPDEPDETPPTPPDEVPPPREKAPQKSAE